MFQGKPEGEMFNWLTKEICLEFFGFASQIAFKCLFVPIDEGRVMC